MVNEIKPSVERVVAKSAEKKAWRKPSVQRMTLGVTASGGSSSNSDGGGDLPTFTAS